MLTVNMHEAKSQLSALVEAVNAGEEVVIARAGKPVARLVPYRAQAEPRRPGGWEGRIWVADDFDAPLPEDLQRLFEGDLP
jgi:prevent-host-death family protein